jgi:hypothetical protein
MTKATKSSAADGIVPPKKPSQETFDQLVREYQLTESQANELAIVMSHLLADAEAYINTLGQLAPRKRRVERLKRMEKAFHRLHYEVRTSGELMDQFLPSETKEALGRALTFAAISKAIGEEKVPRNFNHFKELIIDRDGQLTMQALEAEFEPQRRTLGIEFGHLLFAALMDELYRPFARWVELEKEHKGGAPAKFLRNLIIQRLAEVSQGLIGTRATTTAGGRFEKLCNSVLLAMGQSNEGLDKAIPAVLKKMKEERFK